MEQNWSRSEAEAKKQSSTVGRALDRFLEESKRFGSVRTTEQQQYMIHAQYYYLNGQPETLRLCWEQGASNNVIDLKNKKNSKGSLQAIWS